MKGKIKTGDAVIICSVLVLALAVFILSFFLFSSDSAVQLAVSCDGTEKVYSLDSDSVFTIENNGYTLTVRIEESSVYVESADCPDNTCVHTGRIDRAGEVIACVPAEVMLRIIGEEADYDFIAG